jgi:hypothetical protein
VKSGIKGPADRRSKDLLSLMKSDYNNSLTITQQRVPVSTRNQVNKSLMRKPETAKSIKFDGQILMQAS